MECATFFTLIVYIIIMTSLNVCKCLSMDDVGRRLHVISPEKTQGPNYKQHPWQIASVLL